MQINLNQNSENPWPFEKWTTDQYRSYYFENVNFGRNICEKSRVAVVSLARNCEKNLQKSIDQIAKLQSAELKFFIYENNSIDKTKEILLDNQSKNSQIKISLNADDTPHLTNRSRERTNNLAKYRNLCVDWAKQECSDFDYAIVLDLDADAGFSINGIYNSISWLSKIENSAGMGSYSLYFNKNKLNHYDTFAVRVKDWHESLDTPDNEERKYSTYHPEIGSEPVNFYSCFGGLCVYKMKCFIEGNYDGSIGCEHVLFHKSIRDKGYDMYLNPSSIFFAVVK